MPRKSDAREKMIQTASQLFRARGYHGVGLAEILKESGAPKGSFYHHFPNGKDELALAVVENGGKFISKLINKAFEGAGSVEHAIDRLIDVIADAFRQSGFEMGCPVTPLLLDMTPYDEEVRRVANGVFENWINRMIEHSKALGISQEEVASYEKAFRSFLIAIEGGWIVSRTTHTVEPILLANSVFKEMLKASRSSAA